jgi:hypothetical protein
VPVDRPAHRVIRWAAIFALVAIVVLRATGRLG